MHSFYFKDEDTEVVIKNISQGIPYAELTELYFNFLQAAGYSLTRTDFAEMVQDIFGDL